MNNIGTKAHRIERVIIDPDWVVSVMCHVMASWTKDEPNKENAWLAKKRAAFRFQLDCNGNATYHPFVRVGPNNYIMKWTVGKEWIGEYTFVIFS